MMDNAALQSNGSISRTSLQDSHVETAVNDPSPIDVAKQSNALYLALEKDNKKLFEFESKTQFKQQQVGMTHDLTHAFAGKPF